MKNLPDIIFLDIGIENHEVEDFKDLEEVTWSEDNATDHGIAYGRMELTNNLITAAKAMIKDIEAKPSSARYDTHVRKLKDALAKFYKTNKRR